MSGLRIGNSAEAEHFPEKNTKGPDVTFVVHLQSEKEKRILHSISCQVHKYQRTHLPVHQNLGRHPPNWKTSRGVVQLLNGGVQRVGEAEVGHFCNCAFLSEQDVPEKRWNIFFAIWLSPGSKISVHYLVLLKELHPATHLLTSLNINFICFCPFKRHGYWRLTNSQAININKNFFCCCPFQKTLT